MAQGFSIRPVPGDPQEVGTPRRGQWLSWLSPLQAAMSSAPGPVTAPLAHLPRMACGGCTFHSVKFSGLQQGLGELQYLPCAALKANAIGMCPGDGQQASGTKTERDRERLPAGGHSGPAVNPG